MLYIEYCIKMAFVCMKTPINLELVICNTKYATETDLAMWKSTCSLYRS